ncbi:hypothetical protein PCE1_003398 [Barthelona sp. PCE]
MTTDVSIEGKDTVKGQEEPHSEPNIALLQNIYALHTMAMKQSCNIQNERFSLFVNESEDATDEQKASFTEIDQLDWPTFEDVYLRFKKGEDIPLKSIEIKQKNHYSCNLDIVPRKGKFDGDPSSIGRKTAIKMGKKGGRGKKSRKF